MRHRVRCRRAPVNDIKRPAASGQQSERHPLQRQGLTIAGWRKQGEQPEHGERDPDKIDGATRSERGHGQWPGEFDRDGQPQRDGLQRAVEGQVHAAKRQAVNDQGARLLARKAYAPGAPDDAEHRGGEPGAQGRRARGADQREEALGQSGAGLETGHRDHQHDDGNDQRGSAAVGLLHVELETIAVTSKGSTQIARIACLVWIGDVEALTGIGSVNLGDSTNFRRTRVDAVSSVILLLSLIPHVREVGPEEIQ
jgi:hypothetical protein